MQLRGKMVSDINAFITFLSSLVGPVMRIQPEYWDDCGVKTQYLEDSES